MMKIDKVIMYRSGNEWRWKRVSTNGRIVGASTEGYKRKIDAMENAYRQLERFILVTK